MKINRFNICVTFLIFLFATTSLFFFVTPTCTENQILGFMADRIEIIVDRVGSGDFAKIQDAVDFVVKMTQYVKYDRRRFVIYVKSGIYEEYVKIGSNANNITMIGDGMNKTIITGNKSVKGSNVSTFNTATFVVDGDGFVATGITFRNTAGHTQGQAVALRSSSDSSVFYRCSFEGYQDTLYVFGNRQFYRECDIYGTVDFIFGNAAALFQNCTIYSRSTSHVPNVITAQSRLEPNESTGIVIQDSRVLAEPNKDPVQTYLGRPWGNSSRTVFIRTYLDSSIDETGWLDWDYRSLGTTLYYGEYENIGPGSSVEKRVDWVGYHFIKNETEAIEFTVDNFINRDSWLPRINVPFSSGL